MSEELPARPCKSTYCEDDLVTLFDFLSTRIAVVEALARLAQEGPWDMNETDDEIRSAQPHRGTVATVRISTTREHIARHDPTRVLVDCEVKRQIAYSEGLSWVIANTHVDFINSAEQMSHVMRNADTRTIRLLASSFCDHPDYREEWKL